MQLWVPTLAATKRLVVLAFLVFAVLVAGAIAIPHFQLEDRVVYFPFIAIALVLLVCWPAICVIAARVSLNALKAD
jgi:hypothetical protein